MAIQSAPQARAKARNAKAEVAEPARQAREPARKQTESGYYDRDGNPLVRKNPGYRNEYDFKAGEVPEGWEYQWIRHTVHGDPSESELWDMQENGWRPVPHKRHEGRFAPFELQGKACIMRKGQLLVERPIAMCDEARNEQKRDADAAIHNQFKQFAVPLPDNVRAMGLANRGAIARRSDDVQSVRSDFMPKHELAIDE